jgi:hypothetical protein
VTRGRVVHCKKEAHDVYIGRPSRWGNPFTHLRSDHSAVWVVESREEAIDRYRSDLRKRVRQGEPGLVEALAELYGKVLGCWCSPKPCHGDVLLEAAEWARSYLEEKNA